MSKSQSNTPYNVKSMNGIITLSDGAGTTIENGAITTNEIDAQGKIKAIQIEANEVLFTDNLDMNNNNILQVNNIALTTINGGAYPPATADTLSAVLANGNSAGSNDINMNSQNITNVTNINGAAYPPASSVDNLADTLTQGNSAGSTSIDMNSQDLQNVDELQVDNITGRNGVLNQIRLNSALDVNGKNLENCEAINFSATTAGITNGNDIEIQPGLTSGDLTVNLSFNASNKMNITGGDLDMNTNNILNATNINTTTINGSAPATALPKFFIGAFAYIGSIGYSDLADTFFGSATGTGTANRYYVLNDPTSGIGAVGTARRLCWTNDPTFKMKVCRVTSATNRVGVILPPGLWNIKVNFGELQTNSSAQQPIQFFVDNTNSGTFNDAAGGNRAEQQKTRYRTVRGGGNYHAVPAMDWNVYIGNPNIPETNSGVAKILGIESSITPFQDFGGWMMECTQLEAYSWAGGYNGFTPSTAASGTIDTVGVWSVRNLND